MTEADPSLTAAAFNWLLGTVLTLSLFFGGFTMRRTARKHDEIEARIRMLEKDSVTHADLQRIEDKFDKLVDRLDRILERSQ
jgi:hypothetical protein